jgi:hypothetical protein
MSQKPQLPDCVASAQFRSIITMAAREPTPLITDPIPPDYNLARPPIESYNLEKAWNQLQQHGLTHLVKKVAPKHWTNTDFLTPQQREYCGLGEKKFRVGEYDPRLIRGAPKIVVSEPKEPSKNPAPSIGANKAPEDKLPEQQERGVRSERIVRKRMAELTLEELEKQSERKK